MPRNTNIAPLWVRDLLDGDKRDAAEPLGGVAAKKGCLQGSDVQQVAPFERHLRHGSRNESKNSSFEIRKASRARAPDSPMPGEGMGEAHAPNATTGM